MMKFKFVISFLFLALFPSFISAGNYSGTLKGIVVDGETNEPVPSAVIKISEKDSYLTTNIDGTFSIPKLEEGRYTFEVSHLAYDKNIITFLYSENTEKNLIIYLTPKSIEINQVVVSTGKSKTIFDDLNELSNVLKGRELEKDMGQTLASTLKNETGLAIRSMGPAPARPVIRGLGSDRVLISEDGNKTTDLSASSPDHAVTIEPFSLKRIEVLRGPKVLLKTPTTIGGVVNVIRNEIPEEYHEHFYGMAGLYGESANKGYLGSVVIDVPYNNFILRGEASKKNSENLETPVGVLKNSYAENLNYSFGGSYFTDFGFVGASFRNFELDYGVPGGFIGAHPNGVDIEMFRQQYNFRTNVKFKSSAFDELDIHFS
ncbi:MAG: TonB-dependent receptor plug domain-containing protein, partial [Melioribacteraceae bacterium]